MAAFTDVVVTEKRNSPNALMIRGNCVYSRTVEFVVPASSTVATGDLTGLKLPPGTLVLGGFIKPSATLGTSTVALKTETAAVTFVAAAVATAERGLAIAAAATLAVPTSATADDQVQLVIASATTPAAAITVELTLILSTVGAPVGGYTTQEG